MWRPRWNCKLHKKWILQTGTKDKAWLWGKVIHYELRKRLKFDHANKWYWHKPESVQENDTHEILLDFEIQTSYPISIWKPDLKLINNNNNNNAV